MQSPNNKLPEIGYLFHTPSSDHPSGNVQLEIHVSSIPTKEHFDVKYANFCVKTSETDIDKLIVSHPWNFEKSAQVCAGAVVLEDRFGEKVEAFTFGGKLTIKTEELQTICTLASNAPILENTEASPLEKLFIDEVKIILARYRAVTPNQQAFEAALCETDPITLYAACLNKLISHADVMSSKNDTHLNLESYLHTQLHRLKAAGVLKGHHMDLEDIFSAAS